MTSPDHENPAAIAVATGQIESQCSVDLAPEFPADKAEPEPALSAILAACRELAERLHERRRGRP